MIPSGAALPRATVQRCAGPPAPPRTEPPRTAPATRSHRAWIALLLLASAIVALVPARLRVNLSASLPRGLYRLDPACGRAALSPGDFVLACPPAAFARLASARGYLPPGPCPGGTQPLGKLVLALPSDRLDLGPAGIALDPRTSSGIVATAQAHLSLFRDPVLAANTARSDFAPLDLVALDRPISLYLTLAPADLQRLRGPIRLILNQLCRALTERLDFESASSRPAHRHPLLLLLDEFAVLGKLDFFGRAMAYLRGYGIRVYLSIQSLAQLHDIYGPHQSITANCPLQIAFAPADLETAELLSRFLGPTTVHLAKRALNAAPLAFGPRRHTLPSTSTPAPSSPPKRSAASPTPTPSSSPPATPPSAPAAPPTTPTPTSPSAAASRHPRLQATFRKQADVRRRCSSHRDRHPAQQATDLRQSAVGEGHFLESQLAMRAKAHELENLLGGFSVHQDQIGLQVAIPMIRPLARKGMIVVALGKRKVGNEEIEDFAQEGLDVTVLRSGFDLLVIALEGSGALNPAHRDPASARPR
jgi:type IV secretory pathway protease TraF